jgi:hypothetical protein
MGLNVTVTDEDGKTGDVVLLSLPDLCPLCEKHGQPKFLTAVCNLAGGTIDPITFTVEAAFRCPVARCRSIYVATYRTLGIESSVLPALSLIRTARQNYTDPKTFPAAISSLSPNFCIIYNQSLTAENNGLLAVCGPGYRKSLEFLVKDFLIKHKFKKEPAKRKDVKGKLLGAVINEYLDEDRLKECAKRAAWLGNDETHYTRRWTNKDLEDLKLLIVLSVNFIESVVESARYMKSMPKGRK